MKYDKLTTEKKVHEVDLREDVDQVEDFANEQFQCVNGVPVLVARKVVDDKADLLLLLVSINDGLV